MSNLQKEMSLMKQDVGALKKHFDQGMAQVSIAAESMEKVVSTLRKRAAQSEQAKSAIEKSKTPK